MLIYPRGTFTGNYSPIGEESKADSIAAFEFGYRPDSPGLSNISLAEHIAINYGDSGLPMFLSELIARALLEINPDLQAEEVLEGGHVTYFGASGIATRGELEQLDHHLEKRNLSNPIFVAQACHVARVAVQGVKLGMTPIVPDDLPNTFDPQSEQSWTKGPVRWGIREAFIAVPGLKFIKHQL